MADANKSGPEGASRVSLIGIFLAAGGWLLWVVWEAGVIPATAAERGVYGDFIGGLTNPGLSLCAFAGLLMTIHLQGKELAATRRTLAETAKAQQEATQLMGSQLEAAKASALAQGEAAKAQQLAAVALQRQAHFGQRAAQLAAYASALQAIDNELNAAAAANPRALASRGDFGVLLARRDEMFQRVMALALEIGSAEDQEVVGA